MSAVRSVLVAAVLMVGCSSNEPASSEGSCCSMQVVRYDAARKCITADTRTIDCVSRAADGVCVQNGIVGCLTDSTSTTWVTPSTVQAAPGFTGCSDSMREEALHAAACPAIVDSGTDAQDATPWQEGCPTKPPALDDPCGIAPGYCTYIKASGCAERWYCADYHGDSPRQFAPVMADCSATAATCAEGQPCDGSPISRCIVECERRCGCGPDLKTLTCEAIVCN